MVFGWFNKKKTEANTSNTTSSVTQYGAEGSAPPVALSNVDKATVSITDAGSVAAGAAIADRAIGLGETAVTQIGDLARDIADNAAASVGAGIGIARDRSQSEGSQQSESLIKLLMVGTAATTIALVVPKVFR